MVGPEGVTWNMVDGHVVIKPEVEEEYKKDWAQANLKYGDNGMACSASNPENLSDSYRAV